jgi:hypothetical protein
VSQARISIVSYASKRADLWNVGTTRRVSQMTNGYIETTGILWRIVLAFVGFTIATIGWALIMSVFLSFIGLPVFMFGLALAQAQDR